jgi:hypothetical protein
LFWSDHSVIIISIVAMYSSQIVFVHCCADIPAQASSCRLVGSKMYPAVNASVGDVVGDLPE